MSAAAIRAAKQLHKTAKKAGRALGTAHPAAVVAMQLPFNAAKVQSINQ
jgi:hypothetical protein